MNCLAVDSLPATEYLIRFHRVSERVIPGTSTIGIAF